MYVAQCALGLYLSGISLVIRGLQPFTGKRRHRGV